MHGTMNIKLGTLFFLHLLCGIFLILWTCYTFSVVHCPELLQGVVGLGDKPAADLLRG